MVKDAITSHLARALGRVGRRRRPGLRVLLYHSVGGRPPDDHYEGSVPPARFRDQMAWLHDSGLRVVSVADGLRGLREDHLDETLVAITFDDGYRDVIAKAVPILVDFRMPFSVFVVGAFLSAPPVAGLYLDAGALRELASVPGVTIGAHGHTHRPLSRLPEAEMGDELTASRAAVEEAAGRALDTMSYPHGAVNARVEHRAAEAGFRVAGTSFIGVNRRSVPPLRLRRTEITGADTPTTFAGKVRGDWDWYQIKQRLYWPVPRA